MRQGQQHRRGRGRNNGGGGNGHHHQNNNNNNRKGQNPLTRSFESNGPDVKIRGNPAHIAEKYMALARDATSAGDPVLAENYLQHAEHYNRIILAYREQQGLEAAQNGGMMRQRTGDPSVDGEFADDEGSSEEFSADSGAGPQPSAPRQMDGQPGGFENQRFDDRPPREHNNGQRHNNNQHRHNNFRDRNEGGERRYQNDRGDFRNRDNRNDQGFRSEGRSDRFERNDRNQDRNFDRNQDRHADNGGARSDMDQRPQRFERNDAPPPVSAPDAAQEPRRRDNRPSAAAPVPSDEQPAFLRRPVRRPRREVAEGSGDEPTQE